jgi:hypothetical protein
VYFETSAATGFNVEDAVLSLLSRVMAHVEEAGLPNSAHRVTVVNGESIKWSKCDIDAVEREGEKGCVC